MLRIPYSLSGMQLVKCPQAQFSVIIQVFGGSVGQFVPMPRLSIPQSMVYGDIPSNRLFFGIENIYSYVTTTGSLATPPRLIYLLQIERNDGVRVNCGIAEHTLTNPITVSIRNEVSYLFDTPVEHTSIPGNVALDVLEYNIGTATAMFVSVRINVAYYIMPDNDYESCT